jgi:hypothetical protein
VNEEVQRRPKTLEGYVDPSIATPSTSAQLAWSILWDQVMYLFDSVETAVASVQLTYPRATITESAELSSRTRKVYDVVIGQNLQDRVMVAYNAISSTAVPLPKHPARGQDF